MNQFVNAIRQTPDSLTENKAQTFSTSLSSNVDFFFRAGASRGKASEVANIWTSARTENQDIAIRNLLWARDVRGGAGERELFRQIAARLPVNIAMDLIPYVAEFGRYDDLIAFIQHNSKEVSEFAMSVWGIACASGNGLACKWAPRKGDIALKLRNHWGFTPKQYRKMIVSGTNVVEQKMCAKDWDSINFEHVPSVAASRYRKAFEKNAFTQYMAYKKKLDSGEAGINASAIFPHDIIKGLLADGESMSVSEAQWKAQPNYVTGGSVLCMADVSGSMVSHIVSGKSTAMDVCIALALYTSERLTGPFKDMFMTFSATPDFINLNKSWTLTQKLQHIRNADWGMNTDLNRAFRSILSKAVMYNVPPKDMPKMLLIISDMEFDSCGGKTTNYQECRGMFRHSGYEMPKVVFWNLNSRTENIPVRFDQEDVALISGFSPSILKSILGCEDMSPEKVMLETLMQARYSLFSTEKYSE